MPSPYYSNQVIQRFLVVVQRSGEIQHLEVVEADLSVKSS